LRQSRQIEPTDFNNLAGQVAGEMTNEQKALSGS